MIPNKTLFSHMFPSKSEFRVFYWLLYRIWFPSSLPWQVINKEKKWPLRNGCQLCLNRPQFEVFWLLFLFPVPSLSPWKLIDFWFLPWNWHDESDCTLSFPGPGENVIRGCTLPRKHCRTDLSMERGKNLVGQDGRSSEKCCCMNSFRQF